MKRRDWIVAGVAAASGATGAGWAAWRARGGAAISAAEEALWSSQFDQPQGGQLSLAAFRGKPLLLNFWATWCAPCVKEMPMLEAFQQKNQGQGWQVVGLAVDGPTPVREFLAKLPVSFPIGLAGLNGVDLTRSLGNTQGGLPFSVVFDPEGKIVDRKLGALKDEDLAAWVGRIKA